MNERVKVIRERLEMSQESFGNRIGLTRSGVSNIESGIRGVSERHIKLLTSSFNVNESWLRTGEGEMFLESDHTLVSQLADEYHLTELDASIVEAFVSLPSEYREGVRRFVLSLVERVSAPVVESDPDANLRAKLDAIIDEHESIEVKKNA